MAEDPLFWRSRGVYFSLLLRFDSSTPQPQRELALAVHGFICLLHMVRHKLGPLPINVWQFWLLADGPSSFFIDLPFFSRLDPGLLDILSIYTSWDRTKGIPRTGPLANFLQSVGLEVRPVSHC